VLFAVIVVACIVGLPNVRRAVARVVGGSLSSSEAREAAATVRSISPDVAAIIESPPAVEPEQSGPGAVDPAVVSALATGVGPGRERAQQVRDPDLRTFLSALHNWNPRRHAAEDSYGNSLQAFVRTQFAPNEFVRWPPDLLLRIEDDEGKVLPDFCFRGRLLVEIKGDISTASETDRALGQVVRYLLAWKTRGPALLIVCGDCRPLYQALVKMYTTLWRRVLRIPVTVYFLRADRADHVPTSVDPREWADRALP
jgi:hypothetical protein